MPIGGITAYHRYNNSGTYTVKFEAYSPFFKWHLEISNPTTQVTVNVTMSGFNCSASSFVIKPYESVNVTVNVEGGDNVTVDFSQLIGSPSNKSIFMPTGSTEMVKVTYNSTGEFTERIHAEDTMKRLSCMFNITVVPPFHPSQFNLNKSAMTTMSKTS
ncbi:hypothetical protein Ciccas_011318 [Cichlidogyrus casuarinus]|uniref:PKD domain-containing protein n=1 Tax=Cichlidogyrus casuarinus TaxID=1844966 RepID=A0ABD2PUH5_9PLAT